MDFDYVFTRLDQTATPDVPQFTVEEIATCHPRFTNARGRDRVCLWLLWASYSTMVYKNGELNYHVKSLVLREWINEHPRSGVIRDDDPIVISMQKIIDAIWSKIGDGDLESRLINLGFDPKLMTRKDPYYGKIMSSNPLYSDARYGDTVEVSDETFDKYKTTKHLPYEDEVHRTPDHEVAVFVVLCMCAVGVHLLFRMI